MTETRYDEIAVGLSRFGLIARGGFQVEPGDGVPALAGNRPARTVVIAGNAGPAMWRAFAGSDANSGPDPLDRWSGSVLAAIAGEFGAEWVAPSDGPPYAPFQRWAMRADTVFASPLGLLIHPEWGLWHGYRGAVLFAERIAVPERRSLASPCASCVDRPCLSACPVGAFTGTEYQAGDCAAYLKTPAGTACMAGGCLARHACPVGRGFRPHPDQARFHMRAFVDSRPE